MKDESLSGNQATSIPKFPSYKDHLNKSFLEELGYKIWSTKASRFHASKRLLTMHDLSNKSIAFLSAYLIIFGLISVYQVSSVPFLNEKLLAFGSTSLSILILTFSQMEAAQDFKIKAHLFHECSLKLSDLYNEVRIFKTLQTQTEDEKQVFCKDISTRYQEILKSYSNHDDIDYKVFHANYRNYFELRKIDVFMIRVQYYIRSKILYHALIIIPPLLVLVMVLSSGI